MVVVSNMKEEMSRKTSFTNIYSLGRVQRQQKHCLNVYRFQAVFDSCRGRVSNGHKVHICGILWSVILHRQASFSWYIYLEISQVIWNRVETCSCFAFRYDCCERLCHSSSWFLLCASDADCSIVVGGRHFWLFVFAGGLPYILYTYLIHHVYTLCIYTTHSWPRTAKTEKIKVRVRPWAKTSGDRPRVRTASLHPG